MISRIKILAGVVVLLIGCRESTSAAACDAPITLSDRPLLEVQFAENLRIRGCSRATLHSETGANLLGLQQALSHASVVKLQPMFDSQGVATLEADARKVSPGEPMPDLLSWHFVALAPGTDTSVALAALRSRAEVAYAYVHPDVNPPPPSRPHP